MAATASRDLTQFDNGLSGRHIVLLDASGNPVVFSPGSPGAVSIADGADVAQGALADAVVAAGAAGSLSAKLRAISRDLVANIVLAAGSAIIGKVGIDQTTPGTTNVVAPKGKNSTSGDTDVKVTPAGALWTSLGSGTNGNSITTAPSVPRSEADAARTLLITPTWFDGTNYAVPRAANVHKTVSATASGDNALWTPTSGKKFRLLSFEIQITSNAAISGGAAMLVVTLRDATTDLLLTYSFWVPTTTVATGPEAMGGLEVELGYYGAFSAAANNVLNVNLSATLTSGVVRVTAHGTEE